MNTYLWPGPTKWVESCISMKSWFWYNPLPCKTSFKMIPNMPELPYFKMEINLIMSAKIFLFTLFLAVQKCLYLSSSKCNFPLILWCHVTFVMWSSKMSRNSQILFLRYNQTKLIVSFVSYCLFNPSTVCIYENNYPISVRFSPTIPKQYPNRKCQKTKIIVFDFRLSLLDRITFTVRM